MKRLAYTLFLSLMLPACGLAQSLKFDEQAFTFGVISEDGGIVSHSFHFRNTSESPVVIVRVSSSCGCTTASFSRKPIQPGGSGEISVRFNPVNYPGMVSRTVLVYTSDGGEAIPLSVVANVIPHKKTISESHPLLMGDSVRMDLNYHSFGYVEHGKRYQSAFELSNTSSRPAQISVASIRKSGVLEIRHDGVIPPHSASSINFGYSLSPKSFLYGTIEDVLAVKVNGKEAIYPITISAIAIDNLDAIVDTAEPHISVSQRFIPFGTVRQSQRGRQQLLTVSNTGEGPLHIRAVESERGLLDTSLIGRPTLGKGCSTVYHLMFHADSIRYGTNNDKLRIITDDPRNPMTVVRVTITLEE